ncbi:hypothetical protein WICPIJ_006381 [Wickerhamomyces pijperi]|uniref:WSC domain-containing protein n=1 Tax=Wickerhamomyces pijperi TaxID=599730 RepID=A0A9P8Q4I6_WICPI|nr:hypothetical protein WICPIJ_006381 [Wickerhamomyces pijperi]
MILLHFLLCTLIFHIISAFSLTLSYCSEELSTYASFQFENLYQSLGLCTEACNTAKFALAVVSYKSCFCSDDMPSSQTPLSLCSEECPGYPLEDCAGDGYYGYVLLNSELLESESSALETSSTSAASSWKISTTYLSSTTRQSASSIVTATTSRSTSTSSTTCTPTIVTTNSQALIPTTSVSATSIQSTLNTSLSTQTILTLSFSNIERTTTLIQQQVITPTSVIVTTPTVTSLIVSVVTISGTPATEFVTTALEHVTTIMQVGIASTSTFLNIVSAEASTATMTGLSVLRNGNELNGTESEIPGKDTTKKGFFQHKGKVAAVFSVVSVLVLASLVLMVVLLCHSQNPEEHEESRETHNSRLSDSDDDILPNPIMKTIPIKGDNEMKGEAAYTVGEKQVPNSSGSSTSTSSSESNIPPSRSPSTKKKRSRSFRFKQGQKSPSVTPPLSRDNTKRRTRNVSLTSNDYGTPIIDNRGESTYIDQRLDFNAFNTNNGVQDQTQINQVQDDTASLDDDVDYSRRVLKIANP